MHEGVSVPARFPQRVAAVFGLAAAAILCGCARTTANYIPPRPAQTDAVIDTTFAATLDSAPAGATATYLAGDGKQLILSLGEAYDSARGERCRVGRADSDQIGYAFCRGDSGWYAVPPVALMSE